MIAQGTRPREAQIQDFLTSCQLKGVERISLLQLGNAGFDGGGTQLDEWQLFEAIGESSEELESFVAMLVTRCHEETDAAKATSSFKLFGYLAEQERFVCSSVRLVFQVAQHSMGDDFEGVTTSGGVLKILTSHLERREYQNTEMLKMLLQQTMATQAGLMRRLESHEAAQLRTFELEQTLLDRRSEREREDKREAAGLENQQAIIKQLGPHIPVVLQHLASAVTKGKVSAPPKREERPAEDAPTSQPTTKARFVTWATEHEEALTQLADELGEDAALELMDPTLLALDGAELRSAVSLWLLRHDLGAARLVAIVGEEAHTALLAILSSTGD